MSRDAQQQAVYSAEQRLVRLIDASPDGIVRAFGTKWVVEPEVKFGNVDDVQLYVDRVLAHIGCPRPVTVRHRRGATMAHYESWDAVIALPPRAIGGGWSLRETVVLHELAHHLSRNGQAHGPEFARALVTLWEDIGSPVTARLLHICLHEEGAKVS